MDKKIVIEGFAARANDVDKFADIFTNRCLRTAEMKVKKGDPLFAGYPSEKEEIGKLLDFKFIHNKGIKVTAEITDKETIKKIIDGQKHVMRFGGYCEESDTINNVRVFKKIQFDTVGIIPDEEDDAVKDQVDFYVDTEDV